MLRTRVPALLALSGCLAASAARAGEPISIDALARVPAIQSVSMSTDAKNIVAIVAAPGSNFEDTAIASWSVDNLQAGATLTPSGDHMKFIAASAMKADRVLAIARQEWTGALGGCGEGKSTGSTRTFVTKSYLGDTSLKKFGEAFADNVRKLGVSEQMQRCLEIAGTSSLVSTLPLDPVNVVISQVNQATLSGNYYLYNLRTDETKLLFRATERATPALFDPRTGTVLATSTLEPLGGQEYQQQLSLLDDKTGSYVHHEALDTKLSERYTMDLVGRDEASGKYYVLTDRWSDHVQAWMYDPAARKFDAEPLLAHPDYSIAALLLGTHAHDFNQVIGFVLDDAVRTTTYVEPNMRAVQEGLEKSYPGQIVSISGYNDGLSRVLFSTSSNRNPPAYHVLFDRQRVVDLGSQRPSIKPVDIGEQRWVTYTARDGMKIPALVDLPAGWKPGDAPLPAIVHPHGGPWARDYGGWDASGWVPFWTSRGYAVIRPQYRGTTGLGRKLWLAGDAQWGQAMQDDNDDAAAWLVSQKIAAPERIAIFGYSYGGFAAAAATVRPGGPFQCAIAGAPVTNLGRLGTSWSDNRLQRILQGRTVRGMDPMQNLSKASIPVLLFVGDRDVRAPQFHAEDFYNGVRSGVKARFALIPDMPHSMPWYPRHVRQTLSLMEEFLAKDCGPDGL
jgi:dipeptidyl aminopeptidase/acylaminoacyl peptidase